MDNTLPFDYQPRTRIVFGNDSIDQIGTLVKEYGGSRVLLVTDPGIEKAGHTKRVTQALESVHIEYAIYNGVIENPTTGTIEACVKTAREAEIDFIIGLGGGSSMDAAKGCNFILTNGGRMQDYWGLGKAQKPMLPLIAIPTTAGTGSECQSFALISDAETHVKMACGDPKAAAKIALLDPKLTLSQPSYVAACTGIDAIAHAVESAVTKKRNAVSWLFAKEAFKLTQSALPRIFGDPGDLEARAEMLLGAAYAGTAIENSMLGAAHATANPLTANFDVVHGQAVGMMLPRVVEFNAHDEAARRLYRDLAFEAGLARWDDTPESAVQKLVERLDFILETIELKRSIPALDIRQDSIPTLAEQAAKQWTGTFNPREVSVHEFVQIYEAAC